MDDKLNIDQHISRQFNREMEDVRRKVLTMGGLVEEQCSNALEALVNCNHELARRVAGSDGPVNDLEVSISAECTEILARRQPAASDLRMLVSLIRLVSELERIGDEAEKIGRLAQQLAESSHPPDFCGDPRHLGAGVLGMLSGALDAFARLDVQAAVDVAASDQKIDTEFESLTRLLLTHVMEDPQQVKNMLRVNWCARAMERMGDHAVNICEEVIFLVKGSDVRHMPIDDIKARFT